MIGEEFRALQARGEGRMREVRDADQETREWHGGCIHRANGCDKNRQLQACP